MLSEGHLSRVGRVAAAALAWSVFLVALAAPAQAATDAEQSEALIREGVQLRAQDKAAKALPLFEKAYQLSRSPRTAAQLGLCELDLGNYVEAERYLGEGLATPEHPWIAKNKTTLKKQLEAARANVGELALSISPASAEVSVNKKLVDKAQVGGPIRLNKGAVEVEVRALGYQPALETVTIVGGKREQRSYVLLPVPAQPPALAAVAGSSPGSGAGDPPPSDSGAAATLTASSPPPGSTMDARRLAAWITGGAAVGALVVGTLEAFDAASKRDAFNAHTGVVGGVTLPDCATAALTPACRPLKNAYDQALTYSIIGFAAAGALAAASSVLFVVSSPGHAGGAEHDGGARALACVPDLGARGLACALRF